MLRLITPCRTTRLISVGVIFCTLPISRSPWLSSTTPTASKMSAKINMRINLTMLEVLVANEPQPQSIHQRFDFRTDQGLELVFKLVERRVRVKL